MTTFSYSTGDPTDLVGGQPADLEDIRGSFEDVKTFLNGANLNGTNIAATYVEPAFSSYKTIMWGGANATSAQVTGANAWLLSPGIWSNGAQSVGAANTGTLAFYLDPAHWSGGSRTTKLRLHASVEAGGTPTGVTTTFGLYPIATFGGGPGASATIATLGTVVPDSTCQFVTPAANSSSQVASADFNAPAAGWFVLGIATSSGFAANSALTLIAHLQMRQV